MIRHVTSQIKEYLIQPLVSECLPKAKTNIIEVPISRHFGFVLSSVDSVIIHLLLSLAFMLALWGDCSGSVPLASANTHKIVFYIPVNLVLVYSQLKELQEALFHSLVFTLDSSHD